MDDTAQAMMQMGAGFITDTAFRHLIFVVVALIILGGVFSFIARRGEKAMGLDIKGAIDAFEKSAKIYLDSEGRTGSIWPLFWIILAIGMGALAIAITVIRP